MSPNRENVTSIWHNTNRESLLVSLDPIHHYDEDASINEYVALLTQTLQEEYPDAQIEMTANSQATHTEIEMSGPSPYDVGWVEGSLNDMESLELVKAHIDKLAERIYQDSLWVKLSPKEWLNIARISGRFEIPAFSLRWACGEDMIKDVKKVSGVWELALDTISFIKKDFPWLMCGKGLVITPLDDGNYFEIYQETIPDTYPAQHQTMLISPNVLGISMFSNMNSLLTVSNLSGDICIYLEHFQDDRPWTDKKWAYPAYVSALIVQAQSRRDVNGEPVKRGGLYIDGLKLQFIFHKPLPGTLPELIERIAIIIGESIQDANFALSGGLTWKAEYEKSGGEDAFCREVLGPLLRKLGFENVRYTHGIREHGKDFVFSERTPFGWFQYYGLQAKAGDIKGGVKSDINEIVSQIELAFQEPFDEPGSHNQLYISSFIVAISGKFTDGSSGQILRSLARHIPVGSVSFLDQEKIRSLIS